MVKAVAKKKKKKKGIIGWREKAALPELGVKSISLKVDSGAKTSAIHASRIEYFHMGKRKMVRFRLHPRHNDTEAWVTAEALLVEKRWVKSSTGSRTLRPVIRTDIVLSGIKWEIEVTLVNRDMMGFRMLLGREGFSRRFLVDASKSYIGKTKKNVKD